tara:strand:+ start:704 stop:880 length:177 start_codon:yes stop_codon:yes gene_type:complete
MERIFLNVSEDRAEKSGVFVRKFDKETFDLVEKDGEKKIVGVIFDGSRNMELLIKKVK